MSISLSGLNEFHEEQLRKYIRFSSSKRREHCSELQGAFDDTKDMKMLEDMYSQEDAHRILRDIREAARGVLETQVALYGRMSALYLNEVFRQAERKGVTMKIDFSKLDDKVKLAGIEKILTNGLGAQETTGRKLESLGGGGVDVKLVEQSKDMEYRTDKLVREFEDTSDRIKKELKANVSLKEKYASLKQQVADARRDYANAKEGDEAAMRKEVEDLEDDVYKEKKNNNEAALEKELATIKEELAGSIANSTQFRQLKLMIQSKNQQIKDLRDRK